MLTLIFSSVFFFKLLKGNRTTALQNPKGIFIPMTSQYFGDEDAMKITEI